MSTRTIHQESGHKTIAHNTEHVHGAGCGHQAVPHGDHTDYLVDGRRHHPHDGHCDDHGKVDASPARINSFEP